MVAQRSMGEGMATMLLCATIHKTCVAPAETIAYSWQVCYTQRANGATPETGFSAPSMEQ